MKNTVKKNDPAALLRTFKRRIAKEGWIKSILCGLSIGFGAEIGISTQKLHARGPMGLEALTTTKYIIFGNGQIRG